MNKQLFLHRVYNFPDSHTFKYYFVLMKASLIAFLCLHEGYV